MKFFAGFVTGLLAVWVASALLESFDELSGLDAEMEQLRRDVDAAARR